jgi:hypothetical protein
MCVCGGGGGRGGEGEGGCKMTAYSHHYIVRYHSVKVITDTLKRLAMGVK